MNSAVIQNMPNFSVICVALFPSSFVLPSSLWREWHNHYSVEGRCYCIGIWQMHPAACSLLAPHPQTPERSSSFVWAVIICCSLSSWYWWRDNWFHPWQYASLLVSQSSYINAQSEFRNFSNRGKIVCMENQLTSVWVEGLAQHVNGQISVSASMSCIPRNSVVFDIDYML